MRDYTLPSLVADMSDFWQLEIVDARIVCRHWSVGIALEKTE